MYVHLPPNRGKEGSREERDEFEPREEPEATDAADGSRAGASRNPSAAAKITLAEAGGGMAEKMKSRRGFVSGVSHRNMKRIGSNLSHVSRVSRISSAEAREPQALTRPYTIVRVNVHAATAAWNSCTWSLLDALATKDSPG